ncbi:hypothetical protein ACLK2I_00050 [Escherichia coli]
MRYVGNIDEDGVCRVKIAEVDSNDPLFKVKNGENALAFYSHYYQPLPLVLRGMVRAMTFQLPVSLLICYVPSHGS